MGIAPVLLLSRAECSRLDWRDCLTRGDWSGLTAFCLLLGVAAVVAAIILARIPPLPVANPPGIAAVEA